MRSPPFGRRLKEARLRIGIAQDKLGVAIGLDEASSSARMSRYEGGIHEPPFSIVHRLAQALDIPAAYFFCDDDGLAEVVLAYAAMTASERELALEYLSKLKEKHHEAKNE
jgi:transcriptional regulator with XRE-family HTH domain